MAARRTLPHHALRPPRTADGCQSEKPVEVNVSKLSVISSRVTFTTNFIIATVMFRLSLAVYELCVCFW